MAGEYVTVAQFAKLAGVTKQAIYQRIDNKSLDQYLKMDLTGKNPRKLLNTDALVLFTQPQVTHTKQVNKEDQTSQDNLTELLKDQIQEKDKTIAALLTQVQQLQDTNKELNEHLIGQGRDMARLLDQQQQLQAMYTKQHSLDAAHPEEPPQEHSEPHTSTTAPEQKKSLWQRIFG